MLKSRCILDERKESDGFCISVMSRHTLDDGKTPDSRITTDKYDLHLTDLAPKPDLVGRWYKGYLGRHTIYNFENRFAPEYLEYLEYQLSLIKLIGKLAIKENITVMCIEPEPQEGEILLCHRRLLVEKCKLLTPELSIDVR